MPPSIIWGTGKSEMGAGTAEGNNREDLGTHKSEEEEYKEYKRELAEEMAEEKAFAQAARVRKRKLVKEKLEKKRRGGRAEAQPVNKVIGSSDSEETDEESIHSPFRKEVPSGPYHHYRGNRQD